MPLHSVQAGGLSISLFKRTYWGRSPTYCDFLVVNATRMPVLIKENEIFDRESKLARISVGPTRPLMTEKRYFVFTALKLNLQARQWPKFEFLASGRP